MFPENFEIAYPWVIWLLPLPFLVYWILPTLKLKSASLLFPDFKNAQKYTDTKPKKAAEIKRRNFITWTVLLFVWICTVAALSSPQLTGEPEIKVKTSRNFLIVADISFSMAQTDWTIKGKRANRWEAVKSVMHDFILKREGDRMGLIFFGSSAYIQAPFTTDLVTVEQMLDEADVGMAGQMTNIGKAIVKGIEMFEADTIETKVMLVLTDGVDAGMDILPLDAADLALKDSVIIYTIGIGDPNSSSSDLDETTMIEIAEMTNGQYFRAFNSDRLNEIYNELDKLEPIEFEEEEYRPVTLLYYYPMGLGLVIVIVFTFLDSLVHITKRLFTKHE